ncbi:MAG: hypothetical protein IJM62_07080 [Lachnospiraceae bacterium]|nr:hypothetical protein [Lachnospiraceae bacterium]
MKGILTNNLGTKILSLIIAIIIWFVIYDIEDPVTTSRYTLNVDILNEDQLEDQGKTYEVVDGNTVTITVKGKTSVVNQLRASDFTAVADMKKLSLTNAVPIEVSSSKLADQIDIDTGNATMNVEIEDIVTKDFKINYITEGTPGEGLIVGEITCSPNIITVKGSKTSVNMVAQVAVKINISGVSENSSTAEKVLLLDSAGNELDASKYELSTRDVVASVHLLYTKTVPVILSFTGTPADGYSIVSRSYSPAELTIAGSASRLSGIDSITMPDYSCTGLKSSVQETLSVAGVLPDGIRLAEGDAEKAIAVNVEIDETEEKELSIPVSDVTLKGRNTKYSYEINSGEDIKVTVTGGKSAVENIKADDVELTVDVTGYTPGIYNVQATARGLQNNVKLKEKISLTLKIE